MKHKKKHKKKRKDKYRGKYELQRWDDSKVSSLDEFDPRNITPYHMNKLADCIEEFVEFMDTCAILQDDAPSSIEKNLEEGLKRAKDLIKRLRRCDTRLFKDEEEWNPLK